MRTTLAGIAHHSLRDAFGSARLDSQGDEHFPVIQEWMLRLNPDGILGLDLRGLRYLGYSYAKRTIRELLLRRNWGEYRDRRVFLISEKDPVFLEGVNDALVGKGLFMLAAPTPEPLFQPWLVGDVSPAIQETFEELVRSAPVTTGSLAKQLEQSPQNAKNRLDRLHAMGFLRREKVTSPTGGLEWENRIL